MNIKLINDKKLNVDFKNLALSIPVNCDFESFSGEAYNRFDILFESFNYECLMVTSHVKRLFVFFSAAGRSKSDTIFQRISWCNYLNGYCLYIEDPMYKKYTNLVCGWYYGSETESILHSVHEIVKKIINFYEIDAKNVYFVGSSSAGYAALYSANLLSYSTAYAYNPQIKLNDWVEAEQFKKITGLNLEEDDLFERNDIKKISDNLLSKFIIYFNLSSIPDKNQYEGWFLDLNLEKKSGLIKHNNLHFFLKEVKNQHTHLCFADVDDFVGAVNILDLNENNQKDLALSLLNKFEKNVILDEKLYYAKLWHNFLRNRIHDFIESDTEIDLPYMIFKLKEIPDFFYYRILSKKMTKHSEAFLVLDINKVCGFSINFSEIINIVKTKKNNLKFEIVDNKLQISRKLNFNNLNQDFFDFIEDVHYTVFLEVILELMKKNKILFNNFFDGFIRHIELFSFNRKKDFHLNLLDLAK